jgi:MOSC domain-containing protein YiiM
MSTVLRSSDFNHSNPGMDFWNELINTAIEQGILPENISLEDVDEISVTINTVTMTNGKIYK